MSVKTLIEKKSYELLGKLDDESDVFELEQYSNTYICDAISEMADRFTPIYTSKIWDGAPIIKEYIEEAIDEGLTDSSRGLENIFQSGYYVYYSRTLYNNLDKMVFNMIADVVNDFLTSCDIEGYDLGLIVDEIDSRSEDYDNNKMVSDIEDEAREIIEMIKEKGLSY